MRQIAGPALWHLGCTGDGEASHELERGDPMIIQTQYTYHSTLQASERVRWRVEDILNDEQRLDFEKPFLPRPPGADP